MTDLVQQIIDAVSSKPGVAHPPGTPVHTITTAELRDILNKALKPHDAVAGCKTLILYFPDDEGRQEFIDVFKAVRPNVKTIKV